MVKKRKEGGPFIVRFLVAIPVIIALIAGFTVVPVLMVVAATRTATQAWLSLPETLTIPEVLPQRSTILASDGSVIATFYAENRVPMALADIPATVKNAVIATEDARFYTHHGVDWLSTGRAVVNNVRGLPQQGGSGITQQYVKNLLVLEADTAEELETAKGDTYWRKIREARYALALEEQMTKDEILEAYLNTVYFGDGAYGIGAAATHYFGKTPNALTLGEAALLVGIINNPSYYDPTNNMEAAIERRQHVLKRMVTEGYITQVQADQANAETVTIDIVDPPNGCVSSRYPIYCQWVRDTLQNDPVFGETEEQRQEFLYQGGLTIRTALNPKVQAATARAAREALPPKGRIATAVAVVEPGTGHVLALATNKPYGQGKGETELLLPLLPAYQNGSTFKPLTAAAALEQGINPSTIISAGPTYIPENGRKYPKGGFHNAGDGPGGTYDMAGALRHSVNTWFVELEDRIGVLPVARVAKRMGLTSLPLEGENAITEKDAALTLGAWETSPLQVANAYATLAAHGVACNPIGILSITNSTGDNVPVPAADCTQVIRPSTADTVTSMLVTVIDGEGGTGYRASLDGRPAAGKTGSTNDYGAAWFAGYTPQFATAVWVGDPRGPQYGMWDGVKAYNGTQFYAPVYGGTIPALIWQDTMTRIHQGKPVLQFAEPGGESALGMPIVIPDVRGMEPAEAFRILHDAGFTPVLEEGTVELKKGLPEGTVVSTVPQGGTIVVAAGRPVIVQVP